VLVTPVSPTPAFRIGEKVDDPYAMYLSDIFTLPINIAGIPGISVPAGFSQELPVGVQVLAKPFDEESLFRVAYAYEQATTWHDAHPPL
jgi:aspartyl-tRNA(Asn)/glutamyl-tRNA(Gln) amidotransferase subunit A